MDAVVGGVIWGIWKERKRRIFEEAKMEYGSVTDTIISELGSWMMVSSLFHDISLSDFIRDWKVAVDPSISTQQSIVMERIPPQRGQLKLPLMDQQTVIQA